MMSGSPYPQLTMRRTLAFALVALMVVSLGSSLVAANGEDDFEEASREAEISVESDRIEIRSSGLEGDEIRVHFRADDAELRLEFAPPEAEATELQLELTVVGLVEFLDANGDGRLGLGEQVVQELQVDDLAFSPPVRTEEGTGHLITVAYSSGNLGLELRFHVVQNATQIGTVRVVPTEVKFDVIVTDFPYQDQDGLLALIVGLETETEAQANFTGGLNELRAVAESYAGFFRWDGNATVDGTLLPVRHTVLQTEREDGGLAEFEVETEVALAYGRGQEIVHDPSVGVARLLPPPSSGPVDGPIPGLNVWIYAVTAGVAFVLVLLSVALRRREGP